MPYTLTFSGHTIVTYVIEVHNTYDDTWIKELMARLKAYQTHVFQQEKGECLIDPSRIVLALQVLLDEGTRGGQRYLDCVKREQECEDLVDTVTYLEGLFMELGMPQQKAWEEAGRVASDQISDFLLNSSISIVKYGTDNVVAIKY